jgi:putative hemolysin
VTIDLVLWVGLAFVGIVLSALFSGIEIGVYTLNRIGLSVRVGRRERSALLLDRELRRPDRVISTLLVGNNIAHYISGIGIAAVLELYAVGPFAAVVINTALLLPLTFILGETLPKDLFRTHANRWTYAFAAYLRAWRWFLTATLLVPTVVAIGGLVRRVLGGAAPSDLDEPRQRINRLIKEGVRGGVLSESQTGQAERALTLRGRTVEGEMTPWAKVETVPLEARSEERAAILRKAFVSRLPVVDATGRVIGVLTALDAILQPTAPTSALMARPMFFKPAESTLTALRAMRGRRVRLAVVGDATTGRATGVVAIKDLVEPVTGQLVGS